MTRPLVVYGTRPEVIKLAPVVRELERRSLKPIVCATGQHRELAQQAATFFEIRPMADLAVMRPVQSLTQLCSRCLAGIDNIINDTSPTCVIGQGDTTSAYAAALTAFNHRLPFVHVEAGLRTHDLFSPFPEELHRRLISVMTTIHCAPTASAAANLKKEGCRKIRITGNTVVDAMHWAMNQLQDNRPSQSKSVVITAHRRENHGDGIQQIVASVRELAGKFPDVDFIYCLHVSPHAYQTTALLQGIPNIHLLEPPPYPLFLSLLRDASLVITDSGGVQEEAVSLNKYVLVLRDKTERMEGVHAGSAELVGTSAERIVERATQCLRAPVRLNARSPYGDGKASQRIVDFMLEEL